MTDTAPEIHLHTYRDLCDFVVSEIDDGKMWAGWYVAGEKVGKFAFGEVGVEDKPEGADWSPVDDRDRCEVGMLAGAIATQMVARRAQATAPKKPNRAARRDTTRKAQKTVDALWTPRPHDPR